MDFLEDGGGVEVDMETMVHEEEIEMGVSLSCRSYRVELGAFPFRPSPSFFPSRAQQLLSFVSKKIGMNSPSESLLFLFENVSSPAP